MSTADDGDGYTPREPLTPQYSPNPSSATGGPAAQPPAPRGPRAGPLGARLSQRSRASDPPATGAGTFGAPESSPYLPGGQGAGGSDRVGDYTGLSQQGPSWGRVTGLLRLDDKVTGALHSDVSFGVTWNSRSEMLRACLDEYYRLVASFNDARRLLEQSGSDIDALRVEQNTAALRLREVESRLEFHSRVELRSVYLGAAEIETRLFRAQEERDLLRSRIELLEGFMAFLSRIIATVRAIPPDVVIAGASQADGASDGASVAPNLPADASPDETLLYRGPQARPAQTSGAPTASPAEAASGQDGEEFILDADEAALLASNEFEILGVVEDEQSGVTPDGRAGADQGGAAGAGAEGS